MKLNRKMVFPVLVLGLTLSQSGFAGGRVVKAAASTDGNLGSAPSSSAVRAPASKAAPPAPAKPAAAREKAKQVFQDRGIYSKDVASFNLVGFAALKNDGKYGVADAQGMILPGVDYAKLYNYEAQMIGSDLKKLLGKYAPKK